MTLADVARRHYLIQQALTRQTVQASDRIWAEVDRNNLTESYMDDRIGERLFVLTSIGQQAVASEADGYVSAALDAQSIDVDPDGLVNPRAFAGVASDGRNLESLLYEPVIATKAAIGAGASPTVAMRTGLAALTRIVMTQMQDAGRVPVGVAITARPRVGYVRMLVPPSCSRCVVLAGRRYRFNAGFDRHPGCFPAGTVVSGPAPSATTRRWYQGELVIITTASGKQLPATANHPVLTDRGWVPANLLQEGDHVVSGTSSEGAAPLVVPDVHQVPSRIEDVVVPSGVTLLGMPTTAEDFHGDGGHGDVDVVFAHRLLWHGDHARLGQPVGERLLAVGAERSRGFTTEGHPARLLVWADSTSGGVMGGSGLASSLGRGHLCGAGAAGLGSAPHLHAGFGETLADGGAADPVAVAEAQLALATLVRRHDLIDRQGEVAPRWDAPAVPFSMESRGAYTSRGEELRLRLTGQVTSDRIVEVRRVEWSGHVFNLTSVEGWYSANGIIVSNCDCVHVPSPETIGPGDMTTDSRAYFDSLDREAQNKIFTNAGAESIRDGADIGQVVNARRGMNAAGTLTTEGTTRRGFAGKRLGADKRRGGSRFGTETEPRARSSVRVMPERIYQAAGNDRAMAIRLLTEHGFIVRP